MLAVEIIHLTKRIHGVKVLDHIDLNLEEGGIYGFVGKNGSGKTMLFRAIVGLIRPSEGMVKLYGKELRGSFAQDVGVVIENAGFWHHYTGFENLKALAQIRGKIQDEQIRHTLEMVGLDPSDTRTFKKYSLGMKQKLALAQAFMEDPQLYVLDEPTNALDDESVENIRRILLEEKQRGKTILIASHNINDIEMLCDKTFKMVEGRLKAGELG